MKVFGVGFIKTGTVSLGDALKQLGYNHCDGSYVTGNQLVHGYLSGNYGTLDNLISQYDSFDDFPFCAPGVAKHLDKAYPDSKFILTTRDPNLWFNSVSSYFRSPDGGPANLAHGCKYGALPLGPSYGLINYMLATFGALQIDANQAHYIQTYKQYNQDIIDYFSDKPGKLLVVNWAGSGWDKLCPFLDKSIPKNRFPHLNRGQKVKYLK